MDQLELEHIIIVLQALCGVCFVLCIVAIIIAIPRERK